MKKQNQDYLITGLKTCTYCVIEKTVSEFYVLGGNKKGFRPVCKECMYLQKTRGVNFNKEERIAYKKRKKEKALEYRRRAKYHTTEKARDTALRIKYNITLCEFKKMKENQENKCYICKLFCDKLCVDHCHKTGKVRKLLCNNCNKSLGLLKENVKTVKNMVKYLEEECHQQH